MTSPDFGLPADGYQAATEIANQAFSLGVIDLQQLDSTLAQVAAASTSHDALAVVAPLQPRLAALVPNNPVPKNQYGVQNSQPTSLVATALSVPFYLMAGVTALNVVIWLIVSVTSGFVYFWPIWLCIPLFIFFMLHVAGKKMSATELDGTNRRQLGS